MKTPIGDIIFGAKYAIADNPLQLYANETGFLTLQPYKKLSAGQVVGYCDGWIVRNNDIYLLFYLTMNDYNNQTNPIFVRYADYKKISFPGVATWQKQGIDFGATTTSVQVIIDAMNKEAESQSLTGVLSSTLKTGLLIFGAYFGIKLLIGSSNGNL